jgi:AcrR family transcriptional regulator
MAVEVAAERDTRALVNLAPMFEDLPTARIAFVEVVGVSPELERVRLQYREALIEFIESVAKQAVAGGEVADRDFRFAALALIGAANVIVYDWAVRADRPEAAGVEQQLADLAVTLLTA